MSSEWVANFSNIEIDPTTLSQGDTVRISLRVTSDIDIT
jgi:hypothetical protein